MDPRLVTALLAVGSATLVATIVLVVIKLAHREVLRWRAVRSSHYLSSVGEMVSRRLVPSRPTRAWGEDPLFHDALSEYALLVTGSERDVVDDLAVAVGVDEALERRIRRRFPLTIRLRSVSTLVDLAHPRHRELLRSLVDDRSTHVRAHAVRGLARIGDVDVVHPVLDLAADVKPWEAARLADALVEFGPDATDRIRSWIDSKLEDPSPPVEIVALAARVLGLIGDPAAEPTLLALLQTSRTEWRVAAASALEHTGTDRALDPLLRALQDDAWQVRARSAVAVGALADGSAAAHLVPLVRDSVWWVRQNAAQALTRIPGGIDVLMSIVEGDDPYAADAALSQLSLSGALAAAIRRREEGRPTEIDLRLIKRADELPHFHHPASL